MSEPICIGVLGLGNVGAGVLEVLDRNADVLTQRTGKRLVVKTVLVHDLHKKRSVSLGSATLTVNAEDILNDPDIRIVVEVMGGEQPAYDYICAALRAGKYVVTANKEVVSKHKKTFFELARKHHTDIYFEASVGGGIPIIRSLKVGYAANQVKAFYGILNGTTNYILTQISEKNQSFEVALKTAQELGFAEADPTMDVSGLDTAYKLSILAAVALKSEVQVSDISYEGIEKVTLHDIRHAREMGYAIKLLAIGQQTGRGGISLRVHPTMIPLSHPLAHVRNELNALFMVGDMVGEAMLLGRGAGSLPTGSAVVSDIVDIVFDMAYEEPKRTQRNLEPHYEGAVLVDAGTVASQFYIRLWVADAPGTLAKLAAILGEWDISISKMMQQSVKNEVAELIIVTHSVLEKKMRQALSQIETLPEVKDIASLLHVGLDEGGL